MKFNNSQINILTVVTLVAIQLIVYWIWFFNFDILSSGDWGFYFKETQLTFFSPPYIWISNALGQINIGLSSYYSLLFSGLLSKVGSFALMERIVYFWPATLIAPIGSYLLLKKIFNNNISAFVGSIVYIYNTYFLLGQTGHLTLMVAFALAPLIFYFFIRTLQEKQIYLAVITGLLCVASSAYEFRAFYIITFLLFFYYIYHAFIIDKFTVKSFIRNSIFASIPLFLFFLMNLYWIYGLSKTGVLINNEIFNRGLFGNQFMNILRAVTLFHPFWTGTESVPFVISNIPIHFWIVPISAFWGLALNHKNKYIPFFGFVSVLGIFLTKQSGIPFPDAYRWLYNNFPGFNAFREASKFYFLIALGYSVLIASLINWLWINWNKTKLQRLGKYFLTVLISAIFLWNTKPLITGEIQTLFVPRNIPNDYLILKDFILEQDDFFRTLWVPTDSRWGIYTNNKPKLSEAHNFPYFDDQIKLAQGTNTENNPQILEGNNVLDITSIKYVIIPIEDNTNDDNFYEYYNEREYYLELIPNLPYLRQIDIGTEELVIFENRDYKPNIYTTNQQETIAETIPYNHVTSTQISPTRYSVLIENVSNPIYLNFSEAYHPNWNIRLGNFNWINSIFANNYSLTEDIHIQNDSNLNSFYIDPSRICQNSDFNCIQNRDGSYNLDITIYFKPQANVYLGLVISILTFGACIIYLVFNRIAMR